MTDLLELKQYRHRINVFVITIMLNQNITPGCGSLTQSLVPLILAPNLAKIHFFIGEVKSYKF